jgi:uncharacterized membrane protein YkvI
MLIGIITAVVSIFMPFRSDSDVTTITLRVIPVIYLSIMHVTKVYRMTKKKKMDELRTGTLLWWLHAEEKEYWRSPQTAVQTVLHFPGIMGVHHELLIWCTLQA